MLSKTLQIGGNQVFISTMVDAHYHRSLYSTSLYAYSNTDYLQKKEEQRRGKRTERNQTQITKTM